MCSGLPTNECVWASYNAGHACIHERGIHPSIDRITRTQTKTTKLRTRSAAPEHRSNAAVAVADAIVLGPPPPSAAPAPGCRRRRRRSRVRMMAAAARFNPDLGIPAFSCPSLSIPRDPNDAVSEERADQADDGMRSWPLVW